MAAARVGDRGDPGQGPLRARAPRGPLHPPRPDRQRLPRRRRRRAARPALVGPRPAGDLRGAGARPRGHQRRRARGAPRAARRPGLEPDLGRPPRPHRLQAGRPRAGAARRLPRPAEAGLDRRVRVGGPRPLRGAAGGARPRVRLPDHRQQPHRRRRRAPHLQRLPRRLPRAADRGADPRHRRARPRQLRGDADRQLLDPGPRDGAPARAPDAARPARGRGDRAPQELGRPPRPRHDRRLDLPGLHDAPRARGGAARDPRPRPRRALARPLAQRLHQARHLAVALALAPDAALGGGRRRADRPPLGRARPRLPARRRSTTSPTASAPTPRAGAGAASTGSTSRTRSRAPTRSSTTSSTAASRRAAARRP